MAPNATRKAHLPHCTPKRSKKNTATLWIFYLFYLFPGNLPGLHNFLVHPIQFLSAELGSQAKLRNHSDERVRCVPIRRRRDTCHGHWAKSTSFLVDDGEQFVTRCCWETHNPQWTVHETSTKGPWLKITSSWRSNLQHDHTLRLPFLVNTS